MIESSYNEEADTTPIHSLHDANCLECPINIVYEVPLITCPTPTLNVNGFCPGSFVLGQIKKTDTQGYKMLCKDPLQNYIPGCPIEVPYM